MHRRLTGSLASGTLVSLALAGLIVGMALPAAATARPGGAASRLRSVPAIPAALAHSPLARRLRPAGVGGKATVSNDLSVGGDAAVTSSTGVKLEADVSAGEDLTTGSKKPAELDVDLSASGLGKDSETHGWEFSLTRASLTFNAKTGALTVASGKQINPYGTVSLAFTPGKGTTVPCSVSGSETFYQGALAGTFMFNPKSKLWGTLGSTSFTLSDGGLSVDNACNDGPPPPPGTPPCSTSISWDAFVSDTASNTTIVSGSASGSPGNVTMGRIVKLKTPAGASRIDIVTAPAPAPVLTVLKKGATLDVTTTAKDKVSSGSATGSSSSAPKVTTSTCVNAKNKKETETDKDWSASFASNAGHTLTFKSAVGGNVTLKGAPGVSGDILQDTYA